MNRRKALPLSPRPTDGVWSWSCRYWDVGAQVHVQGWHGAWKGIVTAVKVNRFGRVSYRVEGERSEDVLLEDLCGWFSVNQAHRIWLTERHIQGQFQGQLVFPDARVLHPESGGRMIRVRNVSRESFDILWSRPEARLSSPTLHRLGWLSLLHPEDSEFWIVYLDGGLPGEDPPPWWVEDATMAYTV